MARIETTRIEAISNRALERLYPEAFADPNSSWQQRKSAQTRIALLEATLECFQRLGYARTTTQAIADITKISRGTMIYHFPTKLDLISAAIDYAFYKRMEHYLQEIRQLPPERREDIDLATEIFGKSINNSEFGALLELMMAARTDSELRSLLAPKAKRFEQLWTEEMAGVFVKFKGDRKLIEMVTDFANAINEGLLISSWLWNISEKRQAEIRTLAAKVIRLMRDGRLDQLENIEPKVRKKK